MDISNNITEDEKTGALKLVKSKEKREVTEDSQESAVRRGVIRFLVVIVDCSAVMNQVRDLPAHSFSTYSTDLARGTTSATCDPRGSELSSRLSLSHLHHSTENGKPLLSIPELMIGADGANNTRCAKVKILCQAQFVLILRCWVRWCRR